MSTQIDLTQLNSLKIKDFENVTQNYINEVYDSNSSIEFKSVFDFVEFLKSNFKPFLESNHGLIVSRIVKSFKISKLTGSGEKLKTNLIEFGFELSENPVRKSVNSFKFDFSLITSTESESIQSEQIENSNSINSRVESIESTEVESKSDKIEMTIRPESINEIVNSLIKDCSTEPPQFQKQMYNRIYQPGVQSSTYILNSITNQIIKRIMTGRDVDTLTESNSWLIADTYNVFYVDLDFWYERDDEETVNDIKSFNETLTKLVSDELIKFFPNANVLTFVCDSYPCEDLKIRFKCGCHCFVFDNRCYSNKDRLDLIPDLFKSIESSEDLNSFFDQFKSKLHLNMDSNRSLNSILEVIDRSPLQRSSSILLPFCKKNVNARNYKLLSKCILNDSIYIYTPTYQEFERIQSDSQKQIQCGSNTISQIQTSNIETTDRVVDVSTLKDDNLDFEECYYTAQAHNQVENWIEVRDYWCLVQLLVKGFDKTVTIHNYPSKSIKDELTVISIITMSNCVCKYVDSTIVDEINYIYRDYIVNYIESHCNKTTNAYNNWSETISTNCDHTFRTDEYYSPVIPLYNMIKNHNSTYFNDVVLPFMREHNQSELYQHLLNDWVEIDMSIKIDFNDSYHIEDFVNDVVSNKYVLVLKDKIQNDEFDDSKYDLESNDQKELDRYFNDQMKSRVRKLINKNLLINDLRRIVRFDNSTRMFIIKSKKQKYQFLSVSDFNYSLDDSMILNKSTSKLIHSYRRFLTCEGIKFNTTDPDYLSIFHGFKYDIENGVMNQDHVNHFSQFVLETICDNNNLTFNYLWNWMTWIIQNPGIKSQVAVILRGRQGTGKNTFTNMFCKILEGYSFENMTKLDELVGQFNSQIEGQMLIVLNELSNYGEDKFTSMDQLKSVITDSKTNCNEKGIKRRVIENVANFIMVTNNRYPVKIEPDDRRYLVLDVSSIHQHDQNYWDEFYNYINRDEYYVSLTKYFLTRTIPNEFRLRVIPMTKTKKEIMNITSKPELRFIQDHYNQLISENGLPVNSNLVKPYFRNEHWTDKKYVMEMSRLLKQYCTNQRKQIDGVRQQLYKLKPEWIDKFISYDDESESEENETNLFKAEQESN